MTLEQTLKALLKHLSETLSQGDNKVIYSFADVQKWQGGVLSILLDNKLIKPISSAQSIECMGCENNCFMGVVSHQVNEQSQSYIVCDDSQQQAQMGRIEISNDQLKQWQFSFKNLALLLVQLLRFDDNKLNVQQRTIQLGMLKNSSGRKWVNLNRQPLTLELNQIQIPIIELLFIDNGKVVFDHARLDAALTVKQPIKPKDYVSNTEQREQRKAATQAMYQNWQDELERLKRVKPNQSKTWYANQISKMDIAQDKSAATIIKNLK